MCRLNFKDVLQKMILLWVLLFFSSECMAQPLPFALPEQLFTGSYPGFPNARAVKEIEYTGLGRVIVYSYNTKDQAVNEIKSFAEKNTKITGSDLLAAHFGCLEENEQFATTWFTMGSYVVGLKTPKNKMERAFVTKAAEKIIADYNARIKQMFSTPEKCFKTYIEAANKHKEDLIIECLYDDGSEQSRNAILTTKTMISLFTTRMFGNIPHTEKEITIAKVEMVSKNEARIAVPKQGVNVNSFPLVLLTLGQPASRYPTDDHLWIPLKTDGEKWGIDIATTQKIALAKSQEQSFRANCLNNLKQIGLAILMYAQDHQDILPDDLRVLFPKYIGSGRVLKCLGDKKVPEIQRVDSNTPISYTYVKGLSLKNSRPAPPAPPGNPSDAKTSQDGYLFKTILAYDASPENHEGEGRNVLFVDGHVEWMPEERFQKLLKEQTL